MHWNIQSGTAHTLFGMDPTVCSKPLTFDSTTLIFSLVLPELYALQVSKNRSAVLRGGRYVIRGVAGVSRAERMACEVE